MNPCTHSFCPIDHVSIDVTELAPLKEFLESVFGMTVVRQKEEAGVITNLWLDGGIQLRLVSQTAPDCGRIAHIAFQCLDLDAVLEKASAFGAQSIPGKGCHWFQVFGIYFEMKVQKSSKAAR